MRIKVVINDSLLDTALKASGLKNIKDVIEAGLKLLIELNGQKTIREYRGNLKWHGDLKQDTTGFVIDVETSPLPSFPSNSSDLFLYFWQCNSFRSHLCGAAVKKERIIKYRGQFINVFFTVDRCTHVAECLRGSPKVFTVIRRPWIMPDLEPADKVAEVILRCPTGALHFERLDGGEEEQIPEKNIITIVRDGPLNALGNVEVYDSKGDLLLKDTRLALCRCGKSKHKPLCDGMHISTNFINIGRIFKEDESFKKLTSPTGVLKITWNEKGPFKIEGPLSVYDSDGKLGFQGEKALLCGCGKSDNKPFVTAVTPRDFCLDGLRFNCHGFSFRLAQT